MNQKDIIKTIDMIVSQHLDIRTITMGISLMDCISDDAGKTADNIKKKIAGKAKDLVLKTADFCCEYKVGLLSVPTRNVMGVHYDRDKIEEFGRWITNFCRDNHKLLYLKDSYTKLVEK